MSLSGQQAASHCQPPRLAGMVEPSSLFFSLSLSHIREGGISLREMGKTAGMFSPSLGVS